MKTILVVDAQGGGLGKQIISSIRQKITTTDIRILAVGTNSVATSNMLKGGADIGATGENSVKVCAKQADIIVGPIGIVINDAMYGEVSSMIANVIGESNAIKILIPFNQCSNIIVGVKNQTMSSLIDEAIEKIKEYL